MIVIIDYGVGNLASVQNAFRKVGFPSLITSKPEQILKATRIVLPGVGAFADGMDSLQKLGLTQVIYEAVQKGIPLLGICLGMQMLFSTSEEAGLHQGLNLIPGKVRRFQLPSSYKVPHMGWNRIRVTDNSRLFNNIPSGSYAYFVHSFYTEPEDPQVKAASSDYGIEFTCAVEKGNIFGTQFHPEKSSQVGLRVLRNFGELKV
ncbi:MAG TPA: imidazole glycerol phosphate synthase subunit HisH [Syntrophomonadaceae bacterium]|nr:imidazole glycerol phosphate synthase subunit HisH [Syntrophomonadaceae bacterium]HQE23941.1 imidazole glycerol phosphate synthase subunit HisH [Syntrophomonadaceae bacterium]